MIPARILCNSIPNFPFRIKGITRIRHKSMTTAKLAICQKTTRPNPNIRLLPNMVKAITQRLSLKGKKQRLTRKIAEIGLIFGRAPNAARSAIDRAARMTIWLIRLVDMIHSTLSFISFSRVTNSQPAVKINSSAFSLFF